MRAVNALLSNAVKFSATGTPITVRASLAGDTVAITVSDSGMGIGPDELPYVFDRFYRAPAARQAAIQGIGLGLAIAKDIVEAHGGTLTASSVRERAPPSLWPFPARDPALEDRRRGSASSGCRGGCPGRRPRMR
nr:hypothetical protein GCM10020093_007780 [Planobispora longispora]